MTKVLITGATGNVGTAVIASLQNIDHQLDLYAGVKNLAADKIKLANYNVSYSQFDFVDAESYGSALSGCDILFLLPPTTNFGRRKIFQTHH